MRSKYILIGIVVGVLLSSVAVVVAGSIDSPVGPTESAAQMYTVEQIYDRLDTGAEATKMAQFFADSGIPFSVPSSQTDDMCYGVPASDRAVCNGGDCVGPDTCVCPEGWTGDNCQLEDRWTCNDLYYDDPNVCSGQGDCVAQDTCTCYEGFDGANCEIAPSLFSGTAVSVNGLELPSWVGLVTLAVLAVLGVALVRRRKSA